MSDLTKSLEMYVKNRMAYDAHLEEKIDAIFASVAAIETVLTERQLCTSEDFKKLVEYFKETFEKMKLDQATEGK